MCESPFLTLIQQWTWPSVPAALLSVMRGHSRILKFSWEGRISQSKIDPHIDVQIFCRSLTNAWSCSTKELCSG
jgi:hypothetical protein